MSIKADKHRLYDRKPLSNEKLPVFVPSRCTTCHLDIKSYLETYPEMRPYKFFIFQLRNHIFSRLLSDHRLNKYCLYSMIDSGQIDKFGCIIPTAMAKLRPPPDKVEQSTKPYILNCDVKKCYKKQQKNGLCKRHQPIVHCGCGSKINSHYLTTHKKSKKHNRWLASQQIEIQ